jgi:hypothetical protein
MGTSVARRGARPWSPPGEPKLSPPASRCDVLAPALMLASVPGPPPIACPGCGAELLGLVGQRSVVCAYCEAVSPNPDCLLPGAEVLRSSGVGFELVTVVECQGPDAIRLSSGITVRLEEVTLVRTVGAHEVLRSGTPIYRRGMMAWEATYTASRSSAGRVKVKHENESFQDSFFDKMVPLADVRLGLTTTEADRRGFLQTLRARMAGDPLGTVVNAIIITVAVLFVLPVLALFARLAFFVFFG